MLNLKYYKQDNMQLSGNQLIQFRFNVLNVKIGTRMIVIKRGMFL